MRAVSHTDTDTDTHRHRHIDSEMGNFGSLTAKVVPGGQHDPTRDAVPLTERSFDQCKKEIAEARKNDKWLMRDLRSDHAGEVGAVWIYKGALAAMKLRPHNEHVHSFVEHHLESERGHLAFFQQGLAKDEHTKLVGMWKVAGFCLGFFPTLISAPALFVTIHAVETFVEDHYNAHITPLQEKKPSNPYPALTHALKQFCQDEVRHATDAATRYGTTVLQDDLSRNSLASAWSRVVQWGSAQAANVARKF